MVVVNPLRFIFGDSFAQSTQLFSNIPIATPHSCFVLPAFGLNCVRLLWRR